MCGLALGLHKKFTSVLPTQSLALSWGHGRDKNQSLLQREDWREDQDFALSFLVLSPWESLNLFQRHEGAGSECFLEQVSWDKATVASTR